MRSFLEIAEHGSFSRASRSLGVAQPALSRQIKTLEDFLGAQLFYRNGRGIALTKAGDVFARHSRLMLDQLVHARRDIDALTETPRGTVKIGLPPSVAATFLRPLVTDLARDHPQINLRVEEAISSNITEWVETGKVDLAVVYRKPSSSRMDEDVLFTEDLLLVHHPQMCIERPISPQTFAQIPLALPSDPSALRDLIVSELAKHNLTPEIPYSFDSVLVLRGLAIDGLAATILPFAAVSADVRAGIVAATPIDAPTLRRAMALLLPTGRSLDPAVRVVVRTIRNTAAKLRLAQDPSILPATSA